MLVVTNDISHQDIEDVGVDRNRGFHCGTRIRAASRMIENPSPGIKRPFTDKRTALFGMQTR
jgi:hypothetical protein